MNLKILGIKNIDFNGKHGEVDGCEQLHLDATLDNNPTPCRAIRVKPPYSKDILIVDLQNSIIIEILIPEPVYNQHWGCKLIGSVYEL